MLPTKKESKYVIKKLTVPEDLEMTVEDQEFVPGKYSERPVEGIKMLCGYRNIDGNIKNSVSFERFVEVIGNLNDISP